MSRIVIDASVIGPLLLPDEADNEHPALVEILRAGAAVVPAHWPLEVANLGRSAVLRKRLAEPDYLEALTRFADFEIEIDRSSAAHSWQVVAVLALKHGLTPYDAAYLELAMRRKAPMICDDGPLERAAMNEQVELL